MSIESNHYITINIKDYDKPNELKKNVENLKIVKLQYVDRLFKITRSFNKKTWFYFWEDLIQNTVD